MSNDIYWQIREERYAATMAAYRETDHAFRTYGWTDPESAIRSVYARPFGAPAPASWSDALAQVARIAPPAPAPAPAIEPGERVAPLGEPAEPVLPDEEGM